MSDPFNPWVPDRLDRQCAASYWYGEGIELWYGGDYEEDDDA